MHFVEFVHALERSIGISVRGAAPLSWDEDHITYNMLDGVRQTISGRQIDGLHRPCSIAAQVHKLRGNPETKYGDVAVLVRLSSWDGDVLEGVGFLEGKKRALHTGDFSAFSLRQAKRINRNAPHAQLLMYDAADITGFTDNIAVLLPLPWAYSLMSMVPKTNAICTPIGTAVEARNCSPSLYKYGVPLSIQLAWRFFRGFDLHFAQSALGAVRQFAQATVGGVSFLLVVGVAFGEGMEPSLPEFSRDAYQSLG